MSDDSAIRFEEAHVALTGLLVVPAFILWGCSMVMIRSRGDPARNRWTPVFKAGFFIWTLSCSLTVVCWSLNLGAIFAVDFSILPSLLEAADRTSQLARWWECLSHILLFLTLLELGLGVNLVLKDGSPSKMARPMRLVAHFLCLVQAALTAANFGLAQSYLTDYYGPGGENMYNPVGDATMMKVVYARRLSMAYTVLFFLLSVWVFSLAMFTSLRARANKTSGAQKPAKLFFAAAALWLTTRTWDLAELAAFTNLSSFENPNPPDWTQAVDPLLDFWLAFAAWVIVFVAGVRKRRGLWTVDPRGPGRAGRGAGEEDSAPPEYQMSPQRKQ